jgi:sugar O-acyltransferase (sialic acid O-acetyltransferase NeuD family)
VRDQARQLYVAGTGSFALEIAEYAGSAGHEVVGLIELVDPGRIGSRIHGLDVVGPDAADDPPASAVVGVGGDRLGHWSRLAEHGWTPASIVHPAADVSPSASLGDGVVIGPGAVVGAATELGAQVLVGRGALIGHHVRLGSGATLNPGVNVAGHVEIGSGAVIGMGAIVSNGMVVGARAVVAAGAVVMRSVEPETRVQGIPARVFTPR